MIGWWWMVSTLSGALGQPTVTVHFLYGSKPAQGFEQEESRWFGGRRGGHVGLEVQANRVLNFMPSGKFHWLSHERDRHSRFAELTVSQTYQCLGGSKGELKTAAIRIPLDSVQFQLLQQIVTRYLDQTPYDYAFMGMRCAAATDEVLAQLGITKRRRFWGTVFHTFRPRALRKRLLRKAEVDGWEVLRQEGSVRRIWEKDIR